MSRLLLNALLGLLWVAVFAQGPNAATPTHVDSSDNGKEVQGLIAKARSQGAVRVIVSLNTPFAPEGELPDAAAVNQQRAGIADSQAAVLDALRGCKVESVRRYKYTPTIALEVDACGLKRLMHAKDVSSIAEDRLLPPA